ncbi:hypothetical protein ACHAXT_003564 [Thalassiosira profunda]
MNAPANPAGLAEPPTKPVVSPPNSARVGIGGASAHPNQALMPPPAHAPSAVAWGQPYHPPTRHHHMAHPQPHQPPLGHQHSMHHQHLHHAQPQVRYGPLPPPQYARPVHGEFIFQPGPPQHHPRHAYRPPAPAQPHGAVAQRYTYPPAPMPAPARSVHHHQPAMTPAHSSALQQAMQLNTPAQMVRVIKGTPPATSAEVTPSTAKKMLAGPNQTSPPLTAAKPPVQATPSTTKHIEAKETDMVTPPGPGVPPNSPVSGAAPSQERLAAVDAIFAAAEVIAKRPSPPPASTGSEWHQAAHPTAVLQGSTAIASPHKPLKKRRFKQLAQSPGAKTPPKKAKKASSHCKAVASRPLKDASTNLSSEQERALSVKALDLAQTIEGEPGLYRALLLHMALEREAPRKPGGGAPDHAPIGKRRGNQYVEGVPERKTVIADGFFWKDVPELEGLLLRHMEEYYEMSENRPQSKKQQEFNNRLVGIIHAAALSHGYTFDPLSFGLAADAAPRPMNRLAALAADATGPPPEFNRKKLRDRIRCYYKTHVQNSKKRLVTLLKNPTRPRNREVLLRIVDEVRVRVVMGVGAGRKVDPSGRAALKRLEAKEGGLCESSEGPTNNTAGPSDTDTHAPPAAATPRRVSVGPCRQPEGPVISNTSSEEEAPFASPAKPEHAAMMLSLSTRQVSVQFD